jgi:hypothetical protein
MCPAGASSVDENSRSMATQEATDQRQTWRRSQLETGLEMSRGQVAEVRLAGYTRSGNAERVAAVALDSLTNFHVVGTLLDFPAALPDARGWTGGPALPADTRNGSRKRRLD